MARARKTHNSPKARRVWSINPRPRVKESEKVYRRARQRGAARRDIRSQIDWFGEKG